MKITVIREDGIVVVDGKGFVVDTSDLDPNIHVIHFDDSKTENKGHIEYGMATNKGNEWLNDFGPFQRFYDRWIVARDIVIPPPILTPAQTKLLTDHTSVQADAAIVTFLKMSPAQIETYIDTNVTGANAASVNAIKVILKVLAKVVAVSARADIAKE